MDDGDEQRATDERAHDPGLDLLRSHHHSGESVGRKQTGRPEDQ